MPQSFFNQASARLSVEGAKMFVNCNPAGVHHWFYKEVLQQAQDKDVLYIHFTMDDNLSLTEEIKNRYKKMYTGVFAKRYIEGKWCAAEGLIYDMFDEEEMVVEPEEIPYDEIEKWVVSSDYGTANATVFLLIGKTFDGDVYVAREYYFSGREEAQAQGDFEAQKTDIEFAGDLKTFIMEAYPLTGKGYRSSVNDSVLVVVDPSAASFIAQLRRQRFKVSKANNSVLDGIRTVASAFSEGKLKVSSECYHLIDELHTYSWDKKAQEHGIDKPQKLNDHCCIVGNTLIHTTKGLIPIKNLVGTFGEVITLNPETHEKVIKPFNNVMCTEKNAKVIKLIFENNEELVLTENHPVLTNRGWIQAGKLTLEDDIVTYDERRFNN